MNQEEREDEWFLLAKLGEDGDTDNYFGPKGQDGHGHAVVDQDGNVKYLRDPDGTVLIDQQRPKPQSENDPAD